MNRSPLVKHMVVDAAAFIKDARLQELGEKLYTLEEVVAEIRDKATRERLQVLPYQLHFLQPSVEDLKVVTDFSKKTGDYASLSANDLKVLALVHKLQVENCGKVGIKTEPTIHKTLTVGRRSDVDPRTIVGFHLPAKNPDPNATVTDRETKVVEKLAQMTVEEEEDNFDGNPEDEGEKGSQEVHQEEEDNSDGNSEDEGEDSGLSDDEWITADNLADSLRQMGASDLVLGPTDSESQHLTVACMTTDFAMQNVLLHMGLNVVSLDGLLIKRLKNFVLRCRSCFQSTSIMTKRFCPKCGNDSLQKVGVTVLPDGTQKYHLSRQKATSTRGLRYSLPTPQGGKHAQNPIIVEDQPVPDNRPGRKAMEKLNPLDPDYLARGTPFGWNDVNSKAAMLGIRHVGGASAARSRKNPNAAKNGAQGKRGGKKR